MPNKFIVTGLGRCGSNLLKFALKQNPELHMVGEYYNTNVYGDIEEEDGAARAKAFFDDQNNRYKAIGFKIFLHQGRKEGLSTVWDYLAHQTEIKVIHLYRENLFERQISLQVARKSGQWIGTDKETEDITFAKSPKWWERKLSKDLEDTAHIDSLFAQHPLYRTSYESLVENWEEVTRDIQEFIGVSPMPVKQKTAKQEIMPASARCRNYNKLVSYFHGTEFAWMFPKT
ncbi:hypothetical protein [Fodinicurvata fenggangensis]|uniref:hypothetical protein n=1 Tax=Fodinicurvata fenggangensis TaxID=1121830 RepID=UPI0012DCCCDB|nr:hypothetical protein [Fodinicurvata fenggangensis]